MVKAPPPPNQQGAKAGLLYVWIDEHMSASLIILLRLLWLHFLRAQPLAPSSPVRLQHLKNLQAKADKSA